MKRIEEKWYKQLKQKRTSYGLSQNKLAVLCGITREYLGRIENGKVKPTDNLKNVLIDVVEKFNPDNPLEMMFDYVRIRFPTKDIKYLVEEVLGLKIEFMAHEDFGFYSYSEHYHFGDIFVLTSADVEMGILLELKGKGCRQFENFLLAQERSWYDFFIDALIQKCIFKRLDLAINDKAGILNIPELANKCKNEECISVFRSFKNYESGELIKHAEKKDMGNTLYIGSIKSEIYFCVYEKDYEQYIKNGIPIEEAEVKNRFEIRLRNDRATKAIHDLLTYQNPEKTTFEIINRYVSFVDKEVDKKRSDWKMNPKWEWFIGKNRGALKLTTKPEPYSIDRTLSWIQRQVAPTLKSIQKIEKKLGLNWMEEIMKHAQITEKHEKIIKQVTASLDEVVIEKKEEIK